MQIGTTFVTQKLLIIEATSLIETGGTSYMLQACTYDRCFENSESFRW